MDPNYPNSTRGQQDPNSAHLHQSPAGDRNQAVVDRQPRYSGGYTVIPPNESKRNQIQSMAQKEEEELRRWKETHAPKDVHQNPERLGGNVSLAEARQKQFTDSRCAKLQKKLRKEDMEKKKRQEEEEELQKMKAKQRAKSERLREKRQQEDQRRLEEFHLDHSRTMENFLQNIESRAPLPPSTLSWSETMDSKQEMKLSRSFEEVNVEHKRVNSAFLDRLQAQNSRSENTKNESVQECASIQMHCDDFSDQTMTQRGPLTSLKPDPEHSCSGWNEKHDSTPDYEWDLIKLMNNFPNYQKNVLEEIFHQCNDDYSETYNLLNG